MIYLIGSLRNPQVPVIARALRNGGYEVFDDWYAAGPNADDCLRDYYKERGFTYAQALQSYAAKHIFAFDKKYLDQCDAAVLVYPAGKSAHLELGYIAGQGKKTYILLDVEPERYDIMLQFATAVVSSVEDLLTIMKKNK